MLIKNLKHYFFFYEKQLFCAKPNNNFDSPGKTSSTGYKLTATSLATLRLSPASFSSLAQALARSACNILAWPAEARRIFATFVKHNFDYFCQLKQIFKHNKK